jgi:isopenicillin-N N-acyltransferase like protein
MPSFVSVYAKDSGYGLGVAHAEATIHLRDQVAGWVQRALVEKRSSTQTVSRRLRAVEKVLQRHAPATLEQLAGMGSVYNIAVDKLLQAVLGSYLSSEDGRTSRLRRQGHPDTGCSTFSLTALPALGLGSVLVKNRDTDPAYLHLQTLLHVRPRRAYGWAALSTAGAPDVHSSGMNSESLAVVDTHVPSVNVGAGLPRFVAMRRILEECASTAEALDLLRSLPLMGFGNLVLADRTSDVAVVECGHDAISVLRPMRDYVVATNHYVSPRLAPSNLEPEQSAAGRNSRQRYAWLTQALESADPVAARSDPVRLLAAHGGDGCASVCVHNDGGSATISTAVFRPEMASFEVSHGTPCKVDLVRVPIEVQGV